MFQFIKTYPNTNLHYVLPTASLQETISEIQCIRPYNQLLISKDWNQDELSAIMKEIPEDICLFIPSTINIEVLKFAFETLKPLRHIYLDDNLSLEEKLTIIESIPAGVKFILPTRITLAEQVALLQHLPPYTIVACSNPNMSHDHLSLILLNLNLHCILELHPRWSSEMVETIIENVPKIAEFFTKTIKIKTILNS